MRLLLVDDEAPFLEGLRSVLETHGVDIVGVARRSAEGAALARSLRPACVLLGAGIALEERVDAIRQIRLWDAEVRILTFTEPEDEDALFAAFCAGASGHLPRETCREALLEALSGVARGESPLSRGLCQRLHAAMHAEVEGGLLEQGLTGRQEDILVRLAEGFSYLETASALGISESAVKYHLREIIRHLPARVAGSEARQGQGVRA